MLNVINDTLDISKIESGQMKIQPEICDEEVVFENIVKMMKPAIEEKQIEFEMEKRNIDWKWMKIDAQRVEQIFVNLLSNSIKFTPEGGHVKFLMELVSQKDNIIIDHFAVIDNGIGMSEEFLQHLFEPFSQEHREEMESVGGTGLGLSIVNQLVKLMGGEISVESELGKGTRFDITLPLEVVDTPAVENITYAENPITDNIAVLFGKSILLAEDHPLNATIAEKLLRKVGCSVTWVKNGKECVDVFNVSETWSYDAILMDIRMPVMGGLQACEAVRKLNRFDAKYVPIIAMTANAYDEDVQKSMDAGMNAHLSKPIDPQKLYETLLEQIGNRK